MSREVSRNIYVSRIVNAKAAGEVREQVEAVLVTACRAFGANTLTAPTTTEGNSGIDSAVAEVGSVDSQPSPDADVARWCDSEPGCSERGQLTSS